MDIALRFGFESGELGEEEWGNAVHANVPSRFLLGF